MHPRSIVPPTQKTCNAETDAMSWPYHDISYTSSANQEAGICEAWPGLPTNKIQFANVIVSRVPWGSPWRKHDPIQGICYANKYISLISYFAFSTSDGALHSSLAQNEHNMHSIKHTNRLSIAIVSFYINLHSNIEGPFQLVVAMRTATIFVKR